jgi:hypothetical protein
MLDNLHHHVSAQPALVSMLSMRQDESEAVSMARLPSGLTRRVALNSAGTVWQSEKERARASTILPP